jgi:hypothetical protein
LECVTVESTGRESTLYCEAADQAKLQAVLGWLYSRGIEILTVAPADNGPHRESERLPKGRHHG